MKKTVSLILAFVMVVAFIPSELFTFKAEAATSGSTGNCTWTLDGTVLTISGDGNMGDYSYSSYLPWGKSITSVIIKDGVTSIGEYAFYYCSSLASITIPNSVTSIGDSAFHSCDSLTSVTIPDSVTSIGYSVFSFCYSLASITIPDSVTSIGKDAFFCCNNLTSITIPDSVTSIGSRTFYNCSSLTSVIIKDGVTSIDDSAFYNCSSLTSITIPDSVTSIGRDAFSNTAWDNNLPDGYAYINSVFYKYKGTCPSTVNIKEGTRAIAADAFYGCAGLTSITIPDSVTSIGRYAFYNCSSLASITIPNSVTSIGGYAFYNCSSLASITIPNSVTSIGGYAFYNCRSLTSVTISDSIASINGYTFRYCTSLTSITIPNSVEQIGERAFSYCESLESISIGENVERIYGWAFENCTGLKTVVFNAKKCTSMEDYYYGASEAFYGCINVSNIIIGDKVTQLPRNAFDGCEGVTSITLPNSVTKIDYYAFRDCTMLANVYYRGTESERDSISLNGVLTNATWYYESCIGKAEHSYDNDCDTTCNSCSTIRNVGPHIYDNDCDTTCNSCGNVREVEPHQYDNACDTTCNICNYTRTVGHFYEWIIDVEAICGKDGKKHEECSLCHVKRNETVILAPSDKHNYVEDGNISRCTHCQLVLIEEGCFNVKYTDLLEYGKNIEHSKIKATYKDILLTENVDYKVECVEADSKVTIKAMGLGSYADAQTSIEVRKIAKNISDAIITVDSCTYNGSPLKPTVTVKIGDTTLSKDVDYSLHYFDNTKAGIARVVVIGMGKYNGYIEKYFQINAFKPTDITSKTLYSPANSSVSIKGGKLTLKFDCVKSYSLKSASGTVVDSHSYNAPGKTNLELDFAGRNSGTYYLTYIIQGSDVLVRPGSSSPYYYTGVAYEYTVTINNTKPSEPTSITPKNIIPNIPYEIDSRTFLLGVSSNTANANLDGIQWSLDNSSVGTIQNGILTIKKAGDLTVTAKVSGLTAKWEMHFDALDISAKGEILYHDANTNSAAVIYGEQVLKQDIDYNIKTTVVNNCEVVSVEGINLFSGKIIRLFYNNTENPYLAESISIHRKPEKTEYLKDKETLNIEEIEVSISAGNGENIVINPSKDMVSGFDNSVVGEQEIIVSCSGCQTSFKVTVIDYSAGDLTGDDKINSLDGLMLLRYLNGWNINIAVPEAMDVNGDGKVNSLDGLMLLRYLNGWNIQLG